MTTDGGTAAQGGSRTRSKGWLAALPLLAFVALAFGIPAIALLFGAFTVKDPKTLTSSFSTSNLTESLQGNYLNTLLSSVQLSAVVAVLGAILGTFLAQAVVTSRSRALRESVLTASGVLANFGGVPLAFAWIATLGNAGVITKAFGLADGGWSLYNFWGLALVYMYFSVPLMVLTVVPALDGLKPQWREAAGNNGATTWQYWRHVGIPVLTPSLLGGVVLLFGGAFAAYATARAMVGSTVPLVTLQIADALTGNVLIGHENMALALSLDMIVIAGLVMAVYLPLQKRSSRWLR
ncbi:putative spermidine/putrescine transport system permease protein [Streptosporangium subroseum]|jgi:putative spermidine/putrescine transport system permease protein|uniref:Putative spermidine/putrescine transport system permease protein n=1 Tax=Streptosporangium subroseum TaxID=106412 RepID=A0A239KFI5_9ACTN|nr:ABC transporter permease subunit [Streptosporangium subroseum]SNT15894.1 putative spermidine/putrescine transport system permease protein [Streptosporangium subroseum]